MTQNPKQPSATQLALQYLQEVEQERHQRKISALEEKLRDLDRQIAPYAAVNLVGTPVTDKLCGAGTVTAQTENRITVTYDGCSKTYTLSRRFSYRPSFPGDRELVEQFTRYEQLLQTRERTRRELEGLQAI